MLGSDQSNKSDEQRSVNSEQYGNDLQLWLIYTFLSTHIFDIHVIRHKNFQHTHFETYNLEYTPNQSITVF